MYLKPAAHIADEIKRQYLMYQGVSIQYDQTQSVEHHWATVGKYVGTDNKFCFAELATVAIDCLCVSHGNAVPERGFSVNKHLLQDRSLLKEKTIVSLRFVKEAINLSGENVSYICLLIEIYEYVKILPSP